MLTDELTYKININVLQKQDNQIISYACCFPNCTLTLRSNDTKKTSIFTGPIFICHSKECEYPKICILDTHTKASYIAIFNFELDNTNIQSQNLIIDEKGISIRFQYSSHVVDFVKHINAFTPIKVMSIENDPSYIHTICRAYKTPKKITIDTIEK